ncbi:hypothetical protein CS022_22835 [Veronia nyctiphanis]|uniref:ATP-binding protein n=1 Tax=Veronia nyctiphanis TaxID=1278244 RepID=A0A4Q0YN92_9GAMM|nr:ATP-binding protein [Veronia nyctiphanis]RXJ70611.1 hypothetical protein CS022_22835 [Veronia nyctiphanis]
MKSPRMRDKRPTVFMLCGLPTSGKSTFSRQMTKEGKACHFCLDERMIRNHELTIDDERYGELTRQEKEHIWQEALVALAAGQDIILDWSFWSEEQRKTWALRAQKHGFLPHVIYFDTPLPLIKQRLTTRNEKGDKNRVHIISYEEVVRFSQFFEAPSDIETDFKLTRISVEQSLTHCSQSLQIE